MIQIFVNDTRRDFEKVPETWGDLLERLDADAAASGVILSSARFDGVEEPAFREPHATARRLRDLARVDVHTAPPAAFLRECLLEAIPPLQETAQRALELASIFRGHDLRPGHEGLKALASDLGAVAVLADTLSGPLGMDLTQVTVDGVTAAQQMQQLEQTIDSLVSAQEGEDWVTVADILEYDLEPGIRRWAALLTMVTCQLQVPESL